MSFIFGLILLACIVCFIASFIVPFILDRKRLAKYPNTRPYKWGYFVALQLCSAPGWIMTSGTGERVDFKGLVLAIVLTAAFVVPAVFIIKRQKWAAVVGTLLTLNPITWIVNGHYFYNRWKEFSVESDGITLTTA